MCTDRPKRYFPSSAKAKMWHCSIPKVGGSALGWRPPSARGGSCGPINNIDRIEVVIDSSIQCA